ncbi:hypothetical protein AMATHDRAFT_72876 [Amanita thiersii Skay4041]|uniref:UEV domain-containing protein n=1 Tax=Amanita thiersii Skay4041 TaxID=703135 RepID=A0A2A9NW82_9AGAR|nr:hypothetical protein AMATHDRAFT_72876 [Amanita thiersii Skay4041]
MSSSQALTHRWLRQNLHSYPDKDRVFTDIDAVLTRYITLRPKLDIYTYDDGRTQLMLCVHGVLPISFRHASYNIPIALWIPRDYPKLPPLAYVVPTNDMLVRPGKFVDVSGKCEPEYIRNWQRKSEGCNLIALLEAMQDHFSREPPFLTLLSSCSLRVADKATPSPSSVSSITHDRPALPPKPPTPHSTSPSSSSSTTSSQARYGSSPVQRFPDNPARPIWLSCTRSHFSIPPPRITGAVASPPVMDLLDEDSPDVQPLALAPPRPPNPELLHLHARVHEKLKVEVDSLTGALALDAERLRALQADLLAGEPAIRDEMARLEAVRDVCRNVGGRMRDTVSQVETNLAEIRRKGDPEIDEMVCATTIVHNQLINLVAEDNAIEDTIYQLHRALNAGCVDLERFLRTTRVLAEEQFMKRALIEKITTGLSLDPSNRSGWS